MDAEQLALFNRAGELARLFHDERRRRLKEPGPDRPWFFHPIGYWIDVGFNDQLPEYDQPESKLDVRTAVFARRIGALARLTRIWQDEETMVLTRETRTHNRVLLESIYLFILITNPDNLPIMI